MKTHNYRIDNKSPEDVIEFDKFKDLENVLVQVFCGDINKFQDTLNTISNSLPKAYIIGTTTDGEIENNKVHLYNTIISISIFDNTKIKSAYCTKKDNFQNGADIAKNLICDNTKLLILFTDGTNTNGEEFLKGIESINNKVTISGGMAGDNGMHKQTFVGESNNVIKRGAVGVSLNSDTLQVNATYFFDWIPIGLQHTIDKASANRVYKIGGLSAVDFYNKYLGKHSGHGLLKTAMEFPLIVKRGNSLVARAAISKHKDGSIEFAGNFVEKELVSLGFGDAEKIINSGIQSSADIDKFPTESFFIYSCMARRRYLDVLMEIELKVFSRIAPIAGFFTYGEFFHKDDKHLLFNQTLTAVALNESKTSNEIHEEHHAKHKKLSDFSKTISTLTHIIDETQKDYTSQAIKLEKERNYSQDLLDIQRRFIKNVVHETNTLLTTITTSIDLYEIEYEKNNRLDNIQIAIKNMLNLYNDLSYLIKKAHISYPKTYIDLVDYITSRKDFFTMLADKKNIEIIVESNEPHIYIYFNEFKLHRIIDNNITNSIKYTFDNEKIFIKLIKKEYHCEVLFSSHSNHIKNPNKIFDEYYREMSLAKNPEDGFGLGLNLVKEICDDENIEINLESSPTQTTFKYTMECIR